MNSSGENNSHFSLRLKIETLTNRMKVFKINWKYFPPTWIEWIFCLIGEVRVNKEEMRVI